MLPVSWAPTTSLGGWVKIVPDDIRKQKFFAEYETARSPVKDSLAVFLTQQLGALRISVNVINVKYKLPEVQFQLCSPGFPVRQHNHRNQFMHKGIIHRKYFFLAPLHNCKGLQN